MTKNKKRPKYRVLASPQNRIVTTYGAFDKGISRRISILLSAVIIAIGVVAIVALVVLLGAIL